MTSELAMSIHAAVRKLYAEHSGPFDQRASLDELTEAITAVLRTSRWAAFTDDEVGFVAAGGGPHAELNDISDAEAALMRDAEAELERRKP